MGELSEEFLLEPPSHVRLGDKKHTRYHHFTYIPPSAIAIELLYTTVLYLSRYSNVVCYKSPPKTEIISAGALD